MKLPFPASLKVTVPLILLCFAAILSTVNLLYHVPQAEREAEEDSRKRLAQEMSRLQSTLEYLLLKGDQAAAEHEVAVLAHNHDVTIAALTDDHGRVITATRRAWLGQPIGELLPQFGVDTDEAAILARRGGMAVDAAGGALLGYTGLLMGGDGLKPSRTGAVFLVYDLARYKAEARAQVVQQSLYWAGWVTALALAMWLVFHFLLTRRTARLVHAAEEIAAGRLSARGALRGDDELARLSRAFDAMADKVGETQRRLMRDIRARQEAEEALLASEEQYRAMFNASIDGLALWNAAGELVDTNPALRRIYGYDDAAAGGARWTGPVYPRELIDGAARGVATHAEVAGMRRDGVVVDLEVHGVPMQYRAEPHVLTIARDVTERKRAAAELARQRDALHQREKLAALGSLLAGVAHELNNPLSVVVARAVLLEEQGDASTRTAAQKIRTAAERCARIVRTFLAMARQQRPERGPVALNDVIDAALDIAAYGLRTSNVDVTLDLAPDLPPIMADADQLHQVLLNLVINAQQSLQEHPLPRAIRIATRFDAAARTVRLTVADNGPGIPPPLRARVFEPFFTTKPQGVGTGVGLAVSLGIVEAHGGMLGVECPPSGGAVFTIALPVGALGALQTPESPPAVPPRRGRAWRVLVVDDEPEIRAALADVLREAHHRVVVASSGREALAQMATTPFDAVLTDIRMPDMDGRALYEAIAARWPARVGTVAFVTGDTLTPALRAFVTASGRPVIEKPFTPADVRRVVADIAGEKSRIADG